jgi:(2Fe-2S) ferredoxin
LANGSLVTRAGCTGQHARGLTIVIYPEGIWYAKVQLEDLPIIIQEHLIDGRPVQRLVNRRIAVCRPGADNK